MSGHSSYNYDIPGSIALARLELSAIGIHLAQILACLFNKFDVQIVAKDSAIQEIVQKPV
jgi:hypothetical protein